MVVDDVTMRISHVIRGNDHLSNTPKQVLCYEALDYAVPAFAHVSLILGADTRRLSKRHGATSVQAFREQGILPEALVNYLVRLGWSHGDQEIFTRAQLIERFDIKDVAASAAIFDAGQARVALAAIPQGEPTAAGWPRSDAAHSWPRPDCRRPRSDALPAMLETLRERAKTLRRAGRGRAVLLRAARQLRGQGGAEALDAEGAPRVWAC